jgi:hypothetical protein
VARLAFAAWPVRDPRWVAPYSDRHIT